ncbi:hypothetical protein GCM10010489_37620 [Microbacterium saperdae]|nr:hypothetical protein GCM10010489_37620 [Microbacterium saperdae]
MAAAAGTAERAVLAGAARPRTGRPRVEPRHEITGIAHQATMAARWWLSGSSPYGPLEDVNFCQTRTTLHGRYLPPEKPGDYLNDL